jgi:hypothetical protein
VEKAGTGRRIVTNFEDFRREDNTLNLESIFRALLYQNISLNTLSRISDKGIEVALEHIRCIEDFQPITSRQVATVIAANAYSLALAYTQALQPKETEKPANLTTTRLSLTETINNTLKAKNHV